MKKIDFNCGLSLIYYPRCLRSEIFEMKIHDGGEFRNRGIPTN